MLLDRNVEADFEGLRGCVLRHGTPSRVFFMELFQDQPVKDAVAERFGLTAALDPRDPYFPLRKEIAIQPRCHDLRKRPS